MDREVGGEGVGEGGYDQNALYKIPKELIKMLFKQKKSLRRKWKLAGTHKSMYKWLSFIKCKIFLNRIFILFLKRSHHRHVYFMLMRSL